MSTLCELEKMVIEIVDLPISMVILSIVFCNVVYQRVNSTFNSPSHRCLYPPPGHHGFWI